MAKTFRVVLKGSDGNLVHVLLEAKDKAEAEQLAQRAQYRRAERFPLTFDRLEQAKETGKPGLLAIDPRMVGAGLTDAWVKAETEKRKADQARYENGFTVESVEEMK